MGTIRRSQRAYYDYQEIWTYISDHGGMAAADALLKDIDQKLLLLAELPYLGRARPELAMGLRSFPVGNYVIFYRPAQDGAQDGIELVRVLHARRNLAEQFSENPDR